MNSITNQFDEAFASLRQSLREGRGEQGKSLQQGRAVETQASQASQSVAEAGVSVTLSQYQYSYSEYSVYQSNRGTQMLESTLQEKMQQFEAKISGSSAYGPVQPPSPEQVAERVLGFVEARLESEAANGASQERLTELAQQAREGIERGYSEAIDQIESMGLMNETLSTEIDKGFGLIGEGLDELEARFLTAELEDEAEDAVVPDRAPSPQVVKDDDDSDDDPVASNRSEIPQEDDRGERRGRREADDVVEAAPFAGVAGGQAVSGLSEKLSLEIRTRDGDLVTVNIAQLQASYAGVEVGYGGAAGVFGQYAESQTADYASGRYSFNVEGELDEGERQALNDLFGQIEEVSNLFFSGDFEQAFNAALEMGFDSSEIAGFSLNMTRTSFVQLQTYEAVSGGQADLPAADFTPLRNFAQDLMQAMQTSDAFDNGRELIDRMLGFFEQMREEAQPRPEDRPRLTDFVASLLERLE